jgi:hypothetical protein
VVFFVETNIIILPTTGKMILDMVRISYEELEEVKMTYKKKEELTSLIMTIVVVTMTLTTLILMALLAIVRPEAGVFG